LNEGMAWAYIEQLLKHRLTFYSTTYEEDLAILAKHEKENHLTLN